MKIISVGDSAGKRCWETINPEEWDHIVMLGDLVDPRDGIAAWQVIDNLKNLVQLKKDHPEKVILILGNHDNRYLYLGNPGFDCDPHDDTIELELHKIYKENIDLFQIAFQIENHLWTHAGVTKGWWRECVKHREGADQTQAAETINRIWKEDKYNIYHVSAPRGGYNQYGGPCWAHSSELQASALLEGYHQVVGHNRVKDFKTIKNGPDTSITFIDVLDYQIKFFEKTI